MPEDASICMSELSSVCHFGSKKKEVLVGKFLIEVDFAPMSESDDPTPTELADDKGEDVVCVSDDLGRLAGSATPVELPVGQALADQEFLGRNADGELLQTTPGELLHPVVGSAATAISGSVPAGSASSFSPAGREDEVSPSRVASFIATSVDQMRPGAASVLPLPWETNPWLKLVFGLGSVVPVPPQPAVPLSPLVFEPPTVVSESVSVRPVPSLPKKRKVAQKVLTTDSARTATLEAWWNLLTSYPKNSKVGILLTKEKDKIDQLEVVSDVLAEKATATIRMRALDFGRFVRWAESVGAGSLDIAEALAYDYCRFLRSNHSSATSVKRFREAALFAVHVLGWSASDGFCDSRRIAGVSAGMMRLLGPVRRAQPFEKNFLRFLELKLADEDLGVADRCYAGMVLFLVYTRCRFTDPQRIDHEPRLDDQFLRASLKEYKTSRARDRRGMALEIVAPAKAAYGTPWAEVFLNLRKRLNIQANAASPFFVAFDGGLPSAAGVTLAEANILIRRFIHEAVEKKFIFCDDYDQFSSHSCKRTLLSWASRAGLPPDTRRLLGHHVVKTDASWLAYSQDAKKPIRRWNCLHPHQRRTKRRNQPTRMRI